MAQYKTGEMFDHPGIHIVTGNSFISEDGSLVMSMGAGLALKNRYPDLPKVFGTMLKGFCGHLGKYGLLLFGGNGILQTRRDIHGTMEPDLIKYGLKILFSVAAGSPDLIFHLAHPGLSLHKISIPEIDKLLNSLPENVWIWTKE
jgi:hypothetical protein